MPRLNRRQFLKAGTAAGLLVGAGSRPPQAAERAPAVVTSKPAAPIVVASENGHLFKNGGPRTAVEEAFRLMTAGGDVLDALIAGVNLNELDPLETSVGYGGLPNADGVVQLDSCCMHGALKRGGGVACLEGVRTPSRVARAVMDQTDHHLLVGAGAQEFARQMGFAIEADLNTDESRRQWLEWKRRVDPQHWVDPTRQPQSGSERSSALRRRFEAADRARTTMIAEGLLDPRHLYGTINCNGLNAKGEMAGVVTTSGLAFKIPGRVGDSPILGAGLYVDGDVGACGSTGRGEANLYGLGSYQIVENMRLGMHPKDAAIDVVRRIVARTTEKRLLTDSGKPRFYVKFYVLNRAGEHAGVSIYSVYQGKTARYSVCDAQGARFLPCDSLLGEAPKDA
jgi:N4-(beta-N-acetylglucosaminyl)-L-asparaginase